MKNSFKLSALPNEYALSGIYFVFLLLVLLVFGYTPANDTEGYIEYARICIEEGQPYPCLGTIEGQPFIWNIGIINLIAASLAAFGSVYPLLPLFCLMNALIALFVGKIGGLLFNRKVGLTAMLVYMCYPNNWGQCTLLLSETPMILLMLAALYLLLKYNKTSMLVIAGALLFFANWFRSIALIFILAICAYYVVFERKQLLRKVAPFLSGYLLCILVVGGECYLRTGYFVYQSDTLWFNICDDAYDGAFVGPHYGQETYEKGKPRYIENMESLTCFECSEIWKSRCLPWILDHKTEWLKKIPYRIFYMYKNDIDNISFSLPDKSNPENNFVVVPYRNILSEFGSLNRSQYLAIVASLAYFFVMCCAVASTIKLLRRKQFKSLSLPLFIIVGGTFMLTAVIHGETRFKAPFMPFVFILAAISVYDIYAYVRNRRPRQRLK